MKRILALFLFTLACVGCDKGRVVTVEGVRDAQTKWDKAGIRDYNLEWTSKGPRNVHYRVFVRDGAVRAVYAVLPDGREIVSTPAEPRYFGVDGLFLTIVGEIGQLREASPFNAPKGTKVVLKFDPDPTLGYPRSYRRDVLGTPQGLAIDVIKLEPQVTEEIPPPKDEKRN